MAEVVLSVAIIARDEERHIGAALESARAVADELIVLLDARTRDRTAAIAQEHGATVHTSLFESFGQLRNQALRCCRGRWVLFLDADERLTPELSAELRALRERERATSQPADDATAVVGYWIPRYNLYFGTPLKGGGWYPDHQLRLLRRDRARYDEARLVHEVAQLDGPTAHLSGHLLHINIESWRELRHKQRRYAIAEAQTLALAGVRAKWRNLVLQPLREINRRLITWQGYRDGRLGWTLAVVMGYYEWVKYVHLKALQRVLVR
ncbi:glycosyltransferase family 2 protein [Kallotenue papyrolyticum]|uniref:glycosyltransferase family 2 protein n=1 Tax=Kallotenue papyrolyticum TaxID=1325125 RepID=UPI0004B13964|nr:glycosyltransferase family 2 protein [Kallotenue papyrolyticum]